MDYDHESRGVEGLSQETWIKVCRAKSGGCCSSFFLLVKTTSRWLKLQLKSKVICGEYESKLKFYDIKLPDPLVMEIGWLKEEDGRWFWPIVLYPDIFNYLTFYPSELGSTDLSDYKACKAYSYFKCGWLQ